MSNTQTKSYLMQKFREAGIMPATRHGQNFLIDINLQKIIVDSACIEPHDIVLEVGTGTGSLTVMMAKQAAAVITVEIDGHMYELASEALLDFDNVWMMKQDALRNKNNYAENILVAIDELMTAEPGRRFKLCANLPYNIATPILSNLLLTKHVPCMMTATIQKELGDRIVAKPWSKDYGALSVWMQAQADCEVVRTLPPSVFWPAPKVISAIVRITLNEEKRSRIPDLKYFHQFTRAIFLHRRKFLRANIVAAMKEHLAKADIDLILTEMDFKTDTRTEQLSVETILQLTELVRAKAPEWSL